MGAVRLRVAIKTSLARRRVRGAAVGLGLLLTLGCATAPPTLDPQTQAALDKAHAELVETRAELQATNAALQAALAQLQAATEQLKAAHERIAAKEREAAAREREWEQLAKQQATSRHLEGIEQAVTCDDANKRCTIDGKWLRGLTLDGPIIRQARFVPKLRDGVIVGIKLYGIRRDTLPKRLGFKNGDMLVKLGKTSLDSIESLIKAVDKLRATANRDKSVKLQFERKGEPMTLKVVVTAGTP